MSNLTDNFLDALPQDEQGFLELAKKTNLAEKATFGGEDGFLDLAKQLPSPQDDSFLTKASDLGKTILKGTIEGISAFGRAFGPLPDEKGKTTPELLEEQTQALEELLPQKEEPGFVQTALRRGLRQAPTMLSFPGAGIGQLPRSIASGFLGETAKELGAPEIVQTAAELTAFIGPDLAKKLLETGRNKEIMQFARQKGLSDKQITPLLQSNFKQKWLARLSPKRGKTEEILKETKKGLGEVFEKIRKGEEAAIELSPKIQSSLFARFEEAASEIPSIVKQKIEGDFETFLKGKITGDSLMNLYKKINKVLGTNTPELVLFKNAIKETLNEISPQLAKDFEMANKLYSRYSSIAQKLKPTIVSDLINAAESLGILGSFLFGDFAKLSVFLGEKGVKVAARELLLNPRLQQLGEKTLLALNKSKFGVAAKTIDLFERELRKIDQNLELPDISEEDLKKIFKY